MQAALFQIPYRSHLRRLGMALACLLSANSAMAFEQLSDAQKLIYDTAHLANTTAGQQVSYRYDALDDASDAVQDEATLSIDKVQEESRRDVQLNFLSDERHMALPPFSGYRGNPVIIVMLEHIAQGLATDTGGGTLYFRNRIRDALADASLSIQNGTAVYHDQTVDTRSLSFSPFVDDTYLDDTSLYRNTEFSIRFSDQVPAGVLDIHVLAKSDDQQFDRSLSLE